MKNGIGLRELERRLAELEQRLNMTAPPSFDEFAALWDKLSAFDRAAFEADALGENRLFRDYMERLGIIDPAAPSLQEIAKELERQGK